jgi:hypothetical protein
MVSGGDPRTYRVLNEQCTREEVANFYKVQIING